jgi:branched-chain amino acid transport system permease protein
LRGHYFAIGTWIVAEVIRLLASQVSVAGRRLGHEPTGDVVTSIASTGQMREF